MLGAASEHLLEQLVDAIGQKDSTQLKAANTALKGPRWACSSSPTAIP